MRKHGRGLTEDRIAAAAGWRVFDRAYDYVDQVRGLRVSDGQASAKVEGSSTYAVTLEWDDTAVTGDCTCPHSGEGNFCKHLAAVGLVALDAAPSRSDQDDQHHEDVVTHFLDGLEAPALRRLVREMASFSDEAVRDLQMRAAVASGDDGVISDELLAAVTETLGGRGYLDWERSWEVAMEAESLLDQMQEHLVAGSADVVRPALEKAVTRLQKLAEHGDDSGGGLSGACQRAADLYARSCREGSPDGVKLAKWLVKFRSGSPGWPSLTLDDFAGALDDKAMKAYRKAVATADAKNQDAEEWVRREIDEMLLELADHDGDVDLAVETLQRGRHPRYRDIIDRLLKADRRLEALSFLDRAVDEDAISRHSQPTGYLLDVDDVARLYVEAGREDDALAALRQAFRKQPDERTYRLLTKWADEVSRGQQERDWAIETATNELREPFRQGAVLVQIGLLEDDLDLAWGAADRYGAGYMWSLLAERSAVSHPRKAADLYRPELEQKLQTPNTKVYPEIARMLVTMRSLYAAAGCADELDAEIRELRRTYGRRPSLMAALDRAGLPR